jgi:hypothetical protein
MIEPDDESRPPYLSGTGIVTDGTRIAAGDELARRYRLRTRLRKDPPEGMATVTFDRERYTYELISRRAHPGEEGVVDRVEIFRLGERVNRIEIWLRDERPLMVGDKLMGRHGNKGVVTAILPDGEMPLISGPDGTGRRVDLVLSPVGVLNRKNLGQLIETHVGWAVNHGKLPAPVVSPACKPVDEDALREWLRKSEFVDETGKVQVQYLRDGVTETTTLPVVVGYQYFMKLNHLAGDKVGFRSVGPSYGAITRQPVRGRRHGGGQRWGEMEAWALEAWNAPSVLEELFTAKADDVSSRKALKKLLALGLKPDRQVLGRPELPEAGRTLTVLLAGLGFRLHTFARDKKGNESEADTLTGTALPDVGDVVRMRLDAMDDRATIALVQLRPPAASGSAKGSLSVQLHAAARKLFSPVVKSGAAMLGGLYDEAIWGQRGERRWESHFGLIQLPDGCLLVDPPALRVAPKSSPGEAPVGSLDRLYASVITLSQRASSAAVTRKIGNSKAQEALPDRDEALRQLAVLNPICLSLSSDDCAIKPDESGRLSLPLIRNSATFEEVRFVELRCGCKGRFDEVVNTSRRRGRHADSAEATAKWRCRNEKHDEPVVIEAETWNRVPVNGGLYDESVWGKPRNDDIWRWRFGLIDLSIPVEHPLTGRATRYLPVLPPYLRYTLEAGRGVVQPGGIDALYVSVLGAAENLRKARLTGAEESTVWTSALALRAAVGQLFEKGLIPLLSGKDGFLRQRVLGKRAELSGRAVIIGDPTLGIDECGIPLEIALKAVGARLRGELEEATREALPSGEAILVELRKRLVRPNADPGIEDWLADQGVSVPQMARTLGVPSEELHARITELLQPKPRRPMRGGKGSKTAGTPDRKAGRLEHAIAKALPRAEAVVAELLRAARNDPSRPIEDYLRQARVSTTAFWSQLEGDPPDQGESVADFLASMCQAIFDENGSIAILNRAPSLHRYSVQAFAPIVHRHDAISVNPLVCAGFNADFDGDTIAIHFPVRPNAIDEARERMRPSTNLRSVAAGQPLAHLAQEILAGLAARGGEDPDRFHHEFGFG